MSADTVQQLQVLVAPRAVHDLDAWIEPLMRGESSVLIFAEHVPPTEREALASLARRALPAPEGGGPWVLLRTSGSTGVPKLAMHTRATMTAGARAAVIRNGITPRDRIHINLSLAHVGGLAALWRAHISGASAVPTRRQDAFDPHRFVDELERERITVTSAVPTMISQLVHRGISAPVSLRLMLVGGAPADRSSLQAALGLGWPVLPTYGLTEAGSQVATKDGPGEPWNHLSPMPHLQVKLDDHSQILLKGPSLIERYLTPKGSVPAKDQDGWLHTGDLGRWSGDQKLVITGRRDRMFFSGGHNVHPEPIEAMLQALPPVRLAVVFGAPEQPWGHVTCAALEVHEGIEIAQSSGALTHPPPWARELVSSMPSYQKPRRWWIRRRLAKLPSGKPDLKRITDMFS